MRKALLIALVLALAGVHVVHAASSVATLCSNCSFGDRKNYCVKCNKYTFGKGVKARLCSNCAFGDKKNYCVKCNKYTFGKGTPAQLCSNCSFGSKKDNCVKCNRWITN
ncbi:MAG: hypothetical protein SOZ52_07600 [Pyramidobacter sp.]|nr:hypothetical protein [Pyramidobacter sp.]